jgi:hypothetical protein
MQFGEMIMTKATSVKTVTLADIEQFSQGTGSRPIEDAIFQKKGDVRWEKLEKKADKRADKDIKKNTKKLEKLEKVTI